MGSFKCFEDLQVWQKARSVTREIYDLTADADFSRDYGLRDQIRRASVSIMANIVEGFGRHSDKEFANFLNIAHGSVAEVQSHLYVAQDLGYLAQNEFAKLYESLSEISKMSYSLARRLR